jgi:NADH-quinone oxidoreductase subunit L
VSQQGLYLDAIYQAVIVGPARTLAETAEFIDRLVIDKLVDAVGFIPKLFGSALRPIQNGLVQNYAGIMLIGVLASLFLVLRTLFAGGF